MTRFAPFKVSPRALAGTLERKGRTLGLAADAGIFDEHYKYFPGPDLTAVVKYYGIPTGDMSWADDQGIDRVLFIRGSYDGSWWEEHPGRLALSEVSEVAISEVLGDAQEIANKAS